MEKRALFLCNTVYQCFIAFFLKNGLLSNVKSDIIISDHINNSRQLYSRIKESGLFDKAYHIESYKLDRHLERFNPALHSKIFRQVFPSPLLKKYIILTEVYDEFYTSNLCCTAKLIFGKLSARNKDLKLHIFEDGYATYTELMEAYLNEIKITDKMRLLKLFSGIIYPLERLNSFYLMEPDLISWRCKYPVLKIPKPDYTKTEIKNTINSIFNYQKNEQYKKYIFLEESFFCEGIDIGDVKIVESIAEIVGKENIFVKLHPRNRVNRFAPLGYATNKDMGMAWEVVAMNEDFSNAVFITISSGAALTPKVLLGSKHKVIMLYKCTKVKSPYLKPSTEVYFEKIKALFEDSITILKDLSGLGDEIKRLG